MYLLTPARYDPLEREWHSLDAASGLGMVVWRRTGSNPVRPVSFAAPWRTDTAVPLARQMYEPGDISGPLILADALQDAGCDSGDILDHCRGSGPHVCGCWVVDLVRGKE